MDLKEQLQMLASETGIQALGIAPGEACRLDLEDGEEVYVELSKDGQSLYIYAPLLDELPARRENLYEKALALNFFGRDTGGATVAYDESRDELLLFFVVNQNDSPLDLEGLISYFCEVLKHCREQLNTVTDTQRETSVEGENFGIRV